MATHVPQRNGERLLRFTHVPIPAEDMRRLDLIVTVSISFEAFLYSVTPHVLPLLLDGVRLDQAVQEMMEVL